MVEAKALIVTQRRKLAVYLDTIHIGCLKRVQGDDFFQAPANPFARSTEVFCFRRTTDFESARERRLKAVAA